METLPGTKFDKDESGNENPFGEVQKLTQGATGSNDDHSRLRFEHL